jgi:hypothetical protein
MANKNFSQFDTTTTTENADKKFLVGYDSTTNPSKEVKIPLNRMVTTDANGQVIIADPDGLKVQKLVVAKTASVGEGLNVTGQLNVTPAGQTKRVKPTTWGGGVTSFDIYSDGGSIGAGTAGSTKAWFNKDGNAYFNGNVDILKLQVNDEIVSWFRGGLGNIRCISPQNEYGVIFRNDANDFYILQTKKNDHLGGWSDENKGGGPLRNFAINLSGNRDTWMTAPLNVYNTIGANNLIMRREDDKLEGGQIQFTRSSDGGVFWVNDVYGSTATPALRWWNRGVVRLTLDAEGNLTASGDVAAFSDAKLKTNVKTIEGALDKVKALRGVEFEKIDSGAKCVGLIAQEVESVVPQVVGEIDGTKTVAYANLVGLLVEAVKELSEEVKSLKAQIG